MTRGQLERALAQLELARRRRELLFWTLRGWLGIAVLAGLTVAALAMLVHGDAQQAQLLAGAGAVGAGAGAIVGRRRR
jgi:predicted lysophospholipase L1 biosynthesis ABC-type transport system permease subunit